MAKLTLKLSTVLMMAALTAMGVIVMSACFPLTAPTTPASTTNDPAYTAAAETIIAQLTEISGDVPGTPGTTEPGPPASTADTPPDGAPTPTETFPPTSTPMSTRTPLPTDTPVPSDTPTPTHTVEPTATAPPTEDSTDPKDELGEPDWRDTFESAANWPVYSDEHVDMRLEEGGLNMTALSPDKWESWMISNPVLQDFYLEVTAMPGECSGWDRYGLLGRSPDAATAYLFGFTCDGKYSLRVWDGEKFLMLVEWTPSKAINTRPEESNRLGFKAVGNQLSVYANGKLLSEVTDDTFSEGAFGLSISAFNTENFTVQFSEVAYWDLGGQ